MFLKNKTVTKLLKQANIMTYIYEQNIHIFILVVNSNLDPILHRFRDTAA